MKNFAPNPMETFHLTRATSACLFLTLLLVTHAGTTMGSNSVPRSHQTGHVSDAKSEGAPALGVNSLQSSSAVESRKRTRFKSNPTCIPKWNDLFDNKLKQKNCTRRKKSIAVASRTGAIAFQTGRLQSKAPHWLSLVRKQIEGKSTFVTSASDTAIHSNATSGFAKNVSRVVAANASVPDEGKFEEKKLSMNLEKVRMDVLGRLEEEQQQQQQQQQPVHGSANRSSSIPLLHRSTEETVTKGVNYASAALGAKIVSSNVEGKHASALLLAEEERYWMSPCSANRSVVIELAENVLVKSITLTHNEYYSSISRAVLLQGAQILPTDRWVNLGLLAVENIRGAQAYNIPSPVELRYLSLQMHGSYGKETFCTMSGVQVFGKAAMGIIEQEIDREAQLAMRSYADVQAEILKSLDPNPPQAAAATVIAPAEPTYFTEADEVELADIPSQHSDRFQWGRCVVCVDICRAHLPRVAAALAAEFSRQPVQNVQSRIVASLNMTSASAQNISSDGTEKSGLQEDLATSLSVKSTPASASSIAASLSVTTVVGESPLVPTAYTPGTGESAITKDVVATAQVGSVSRGDVDTPKIQLDSNIIRKLWNKLRDLEFNHSVVSGFVNVLSKKHEEQLSQLATSTANLDLALQSNRNSSSCQCPDTSALEISLDAVTTRIAVLEKATSRIAELEAAVARLSALESKVSLLLAVPSPPSEQQ